jgi:hypothetical protein
MTKMDKIRYKIIEVIAEYGVFGAIFLVLVVLTFAGFVMFVSRQRHLVRVETPTWSGEGVLLSRASTYIVVEVDGVQKTIHGNFTYEIIGEAKP